MRSKAVFFTGINRVEILPIEVPSPKPGEVLLETVYSCVSPGTELRCLSGLQPHSLPWPFIPGYSSVNRVKQAGAGVSLAEGTWVFCSRGTNQPDLPCQWGGHTGLKLNREDEVFPLDAEIDPFEASLVTLGAIAYHGLRLARPQPHERVVVVGLGPIGMLSALFFHLAGCHVLGLDLSPERVVAARSHGLTAEVPADGLRPALNTHFPQGADIAVDSTGAAPILIQTATLLKDLEWNDELKTPNRLVVQGSYPGDFTLSYQELFAKEILILVPRDFQARDIRAVLEFLRLKRVSLRPLLSKAHCVDQAGEIYETLRNSKGSFRTAAFQWL